MKLRNYRDPPLGSFEVKS